MSSQSETTLLFFCRRCGLPIARLNLIVGWLDLRCAICGYQQRLEGTRGMTMPEPSESLSRMKLA